MHDSPNTPQDEREIRERLRRLREHQPDTSELERRLDAAIDRERDSARPPEDVETPRASWQRWLAVVVAIGLVGAILIAVLIEDQLAAPRVAEPQHLAAVHDLYERGELSFEPVASIQEAERLVRQHWSEVPSLPRFAQASLKGACVDRVQGCRVACLHMEAEGGPLTLIVAHNSDLCCCDGCGDGPDDPPRRKLDRVGPYHILSWDAEDRFMALVGRADPARLRSLADTTRF